MEDKNNETIISKVEEIQLIAEQLEKVSRGINSALFGSSVLLDNVVASSSTTGIKGKLYDTATTLANIEQTLAKVLEELEGE